MPKKQFSMKKHAFDAKTVVEKKRKHLQLYQRKRKIIEKQLPLANYDATRAPAALTFFQSQISNHN